MYGSSQHEILQSNHLLSKMLKPHHTLLRNIKNTDILVYGGVAINCIYFQNGIFTEKREKGEKCQFASLSSIEQIDKLSKFVFLPIVSIHYTCCITCLHVPHIKIMLYWQTLLIKFKLAWFWAQLCSANISFQRCINRKPGFRNQGRRLEKPDFPRYISPGEFWFLCHVYW